MQVAQDTFISSTMWTDRLGFIVKKCHFKKIKKHNVKNNFKIW